MLQYVFVWARSLSYTLCSAVISVDSLSAIAFIFVNVVADRSETFVSALLGGGAVKVRVRAPVCPLFFVCLCTSPFSALDIYFFTTQPIKFCIKLIKKNKMACLEIKILF